MPYNTNRKHHSNRIKDKKARQQYKKYNKSAITRTVYNRPYGTGVSDSQLIKMKAVQTTIGFVGTGASPEVISFRINAPYEYSLSVSPSQPLYWNEMQELYNEYICYGCKIRSQFVYTGDSTSVTQVLINSSRDLYSGTLSEQLLYENRSTKKYILSQQKPTVTITDYYPINKILGISKDRVNANGSLSSSTGGNPTIVGHANNIAIKQSGTDAAVKLICELVFYVKFYNRKNVPAS